MLVSPIRIPRFCTVFFFNDTATTEIYTLSLHDALPIYRRRCKRNCQLQPEALKRRMLRTAVDCCIGCLEWNRISCGYQPAALRVHHIDWHRPAPDSAVAAHKVDRPFPSASAQEGLCGSAKSKFRHPAPSSSR